MLICNAPVPMCSAQSYRFEGGNERAVTQCKEAAADLDTPISHKEIQTATEERNRIAHGKSRYTSAETMADMITTARMVRG